MSGTGGQLTAPNRLDSDVPLRWRLLDAASALFRGLRINRVGGGAGYLMLAPAILVVGTLVVAIGYLGWTAFHEYDSFRNIQGGFSLENFQETISDSFYRAVFFRTLWMSLAITVIAVALALPFAYAIVRARSRYVRSALLVSLFIPFLVGDIVRAYGWLVVGGSEGPLAWVLDHLGAHDFTILGNWVGVWLGLLQLMIPLCALVLLPAIHTIEPELEQAASILGAKPHNRWFSVLLPLARPGLVAASAVSFTLCMTTFASPKLLGAGRVDFAANTIYQVYFGRGNTNLATAMGVLMLVITVIGVGLILALHRDPAAPKRSRREGKA